MNAVDQSALAATQGRPPIGIPGRAATELKHGRPTAPFARPDAALIEREGPGWSLLGASARGVQHKFASEPRQDSFGVTMHGDTLCVVVADGVGSYERSHEASDAAVAIACQRMELGVDDDTIVKEINEHLQALAEDGSGKLATTLLLARLRRVGDDFVADLSWVGDPYVWTLTAEGFELLASASASADVDGDDAGESDDTLASTLAEALPAAAVDIRHRSVTVDAQGIFFMTDGVGTPLAKIADVRTTLADWWSERPTIFTFASQVEFARRGYMDDRTVVGVWPAGEAPTVAEEAEVDADGQS